MRSFVFAKKITRKNGDFNQSGYGSLIDTNIFKYYMIAMRIGHGLVNGKWLNDFHFWVRHENYSWSNKPGKCVSELIGWDNHKNPSTLSWNIPVSYKWKNGGYRPVTWKKNFYNSSTYYLAIEKD